MAKTKDFDWIATNGLLNRLKAIGGNPMFLLDTGTIIDLENNHKNDGRCFCSGLLGEIASLYPLVITKGVMDEVENHYEHIRIGNRREISEPTCGFIQALYENSKNIMEDSGICQDEDGIRYAVYWASKFAFEEDYRKGKNDKPSDTDLELVTTALMLSRGEYEGIPITSANVLSPDSHVEKIIEKLNEMEYGGIKAIPSRRDLRAYLDR